MLNDVNWMDGVAVVEQLVFDVHTFLDELGDVTRARCASVRS